MLGETPTKPDRSLRSALLRLQVDNLHLTSLIIASVVSAYAWGL